MKIFKIIIINILMFILIIISIDYLIYCKYRAAYYKGYSKETQEMFPFPSYIENYKLGFGGNTIQFFKNFQNYFRAFVTDKGFDKPPLLLFGCSYAYSFMLEDDIMLSRKLSDLTGRNVYNFALCACGIQHMLYIIQHKFFNLLNKEELEKIPEYALFVYIPSHLYRLHADIFPYIQNNGINLQYKTGNKGLEVKDYPSGILYKTFILKSLHLQQDKLKEKNYIENNYNSFMLANEIFLESRRLLQEEFPNIQFVILMYQTEDDGEEGELPFMRTVLKEEGFIVINSKDLIGRKFKYNSEDTAPDGYHPSAQAWDLLLPNLVKELETIRTNSRSQGSSSPLK